MADVAATLANWSATTASNAPSGATTIGTGLDDNLREIQGVVVRGLSHKGADIASATTTDIGAVEGLSHDITGTTTITSLGTGREGLLKILQFDGALTLTHNATSLVLPGGANITTVAGDVGVFISEGSGNWRCVSYVGKSGHFDNVMIGGGYGSTGVTISSAGNIQANGTLTVDGNAVVPSIDIGGGYGSTGVTISAAGNIQANGTLTVDGATGIGMTPGSYLLSIRQAHQTDGSMNGQILVQSTAAYNAGPIAGINFANKYHSDGSYAGMGGISVAKENATSGNLASFLSLHTRGSVGDITERLRIDSSGNLGLGVTPTGWNLPALQMSAQGSVMATGDQIDLTQNGYLNSGWKYQVTGKASALYEQALGVHTWSIAPSGTAGNAISWTTAMTLDASGVLSIGGSPFASASRLSITGNEVPCEIKIANGDTNFRTAINFYAASTAAGYLQAKTTPAVQLINASDCRMKENIVPLGSPWGVLAAFEAVQYDWRVSGVHDAGFIAQRVTQNLGRNHPLIQAMISFGDDDALKVDGDEGFKRWGMSKEPLITYLVAGALDHESRLAALEQRLGG